MNPDWLQVDEEPWLPVLEEPQPHPRRWLLAFAVLLIAIAIRRTR